MRVCCVAACVLCAAAAGPCGMRQGALVVKRHQSQSSRRGEVLENGLLWKLLQITNMHLRLMHVLSQTVSDQAATLDLTYCLANLLKGHLLHTPGTPAPYWPVTHPSICMPATQPSLRAPIMIPCSLWHIKFSPQNDLLTLSYRKWIDSILQSADIQDSGIFHMGKYMNVNLNEENSHRTNLSFFH